MRDENRMAMDKNTAELLICAGTEEIKPVSLTDGMIIGSGEEDGIITIHADCMTRMHGKFHRTEEGFEYEDLGSPTGTYYNDVKIGTGKLPQGEPVRLKDGDVLRIEPEGFERSSDGSNVVILFRERYIANLQWRSIDLGTGADAFCISRFEEKVGEDEAFVQGEKIPELPKHFASVYMKDGAWMVMDHSTKYGVYLNNHKVTAETAIHPKDVIRIGNTQFVFRRNRLEYSHKESSNENLQVHIEERSVWNLFRKKILLEDINLTISPGEMVLILGGSGAGKTTFINAVMGYEKAKGTIKKGDRDIYQDYNQMKYEIGFVPQQDLLRGDDTVIDTLENAAEMKLPVSVTKEERMQQVNKTLEEFGLDREKDNLVEKLSGGQRKRLSIAVEFISSPSLFFLDEPDSGLDGVMARELMENLRHIADQQKIVMVISHAPDRAADLYDKVLVLAKGEQDNIGHLAFYGLVKEAKAFFETETLEGIVKRINRTDEGGEGRADEYIKRFAEMEGK